MFLDLEVQRRLLGFPMPPCAPANSGGIVRCKPSRAADRVWPLQENTICARQRGPFSILSNSAFAAMRLRTVLFNGGGNGVKGRL